MVKKWIAAFAIEDRVDFRFYDPESNSKEPKCYKFSKPIEGTDYFASVRGIMQEAFVRLCARYEESKYDLFNRMELIVVSCPGVIEKRAKLIQLPLWSWPEQSKVKWKWGNEDRDGFHFGKEIADIAAFIIGDKNIKNRRQFQAQLQHRVGVINDTTAAAAYEFYVRKEENKVVINNKMKSFAYLKLHNGINISAIQSSDDTDRIHINIVDSEAGHIFPHKHKMDFDVNFIGTCSFHYNCLEGLVSAHSFLERATPGPNSLNRYSVVPLNHPFREWRKHVDDYKRDSERDIDFATKLLSAGDPAAIELLAHYVTQLVHITATGPLVVQMIVLAGRLATTAVIEAIQQKLVQWVNGYPAYPFLTAEGVKQFVVPSLRPGTEQGVAEVLGALAVAIAHISSHDSEDRIPPRSLDESWLNAVEWLNLTGSGVAGEWSSLAGSGFAGLEFYTLPEPTSSTRH